MKTNQNNKLRQFLYLAIVIYVGTAIYAFVYNYRMNDMRGIGMGVVALLTPWLIPALFKIVKLKASDEIYILNIIFIYFASLIGSCLGGYGLPFFDKALHFSSGIFATILAMMLYSWIKHTKKAETQADKAIFFIFINAVNMAIALLWEFYEYSMLIFFNNDCINHYTTGVHDSITDMLCAFTAGLIITTLVVRYYKTGKKDFFISLYEKFYDMNIDGQKALFK